MLKIDNKGVIVQTATFHNLEDWLVRIRGMVRTAQGANEDLVSKEDVYYALAAIDDMLPDEDTANDIWNAYKKAKQME